MVQGWAEGVRWGCGGCGSAVLWWWEGCREGGHELMVVRVIM